MKEIFDQINKVANNKKISIFYFLNVLHIIITMVITIDMPKKFKLLDKKLSYDDFLSYIFSHDTSLTEKIFSYYNKQQTLNTESQDPLKEIRKQQSSGSYWDEFITLDQEMRDFYKK